VVRGIKKQLVQTITK